MGILTPVRGTIIWPKCHLEDSITQKYQHIADKYIFQRVLSGTISSSEELESSKVEKWFLKCMTWSHGS